MDNSCDAEVMGYKEVLCSPCRQRLGAIRVLPANLKVLLENCFLTKLVENGKSVSKLTFEL